MQKSFNTYIMKREQSDDRQMQYASSSCFIIVAILLFRSGSSNSFAISSFFIRDIIQNGCKLKVEKYEKFIQK